jgi:ubiquitin-protein ligase E3 C
VLGSELSPELCAFVSKFFDLSAWTVKPVIRSLVNCLLWSFSLNDLFARVHFKTKVLVSKSSGTDITPELDLMFDLTTVLILAPQKLIASTEGKDRQVVYDLMLRHNTFFVDKMLTIPRLSFFYKKKPVSSSIRWRDLFQAYLFDSKEKSHDNIESFFMFANIWDLVSDQMRSLSAWEMNPILQVCSQLAQHVSPQFLEQQSHTSYWAPVQVQALNRQLAMFTDSSLVSDLFCKVLDVEGGFSDKFHPPAALSLCKIYDKFFISCQRQAAVSMVSVGITNGLAFNSNIVYSLWKFLEVYCGLDVFYSLDEVEGRGAEDYLHVLNLFCRAYHHSLLVTDVAEFPSVFSIDEAKNVTQTLIQICHRGLIAVLSPAAVPTIQCVCLLLKLLYQFNVSLQYLDETKWLIPPRLVDQLVGQYFNGDSAQLTALLDNFPFCVPFEARTLVFYSWIDQERASLDRSRAYVIVVSRASLVADSVRQIIKLPDMRSDIKVQFINEYGRAEDGIDAGGLFKEYLNNLSEVIFDPNYGLFQLSEERCLYPNPSSSLYVGPEHLQLFFVVGRILGRSIFEKLVIEPQFAEFFLRKMLGKQNFVEDLRSLNREMHSNLQFLKTYKGNFADLSLYFTATNQDGTEEELLPGGRDLEVTSSNKFKYMYYMAHYRLNVQIQPQTTAFLNGLKDVIPTKLLRIFSPKELQMLISGTSVGFDVEDLRANTQYIGFSSISSSVRNFWKVLHSLEAADLTKFLKFATSCGRPPLFGFKNLHPPFTLSEVQISRDNEKLPTASTCSNTFRLPTYSSYKVMRQKLLLAINSGAGFELA